MLAGSHSVDWRGVDLSGRAVASGLYLYTVSLEGAAPVTGKLSLVR
jgi:hypothetical protein